MPGNLKRFKASLRWRLDWYKKKPVPSGPPYFINLEPTNACNMQCTICSMDKSRDRGLMDMGNYERLAKEAAKMGIIEARLFLAGEPLLYPDIGKQVSIARKAGLVTCIHTNGMNLSENKGKELIEAGLDFISFSIDGENEEGYNKIRIGGDFNTVIKNVKKFCKLKKDINASKPFTVIQIIKTGDDKNNMTVSKRFKSQFEGLPLDRIFTLSPHGWAGEKPEAALKSKGKYYFPCQMLWQSLSVLWDGRVVSCCGDLNGRQIIGDTKKESLSDIWYGEKMKLLREQIIQKNADKNFPLCVKCDAVWRNRHPFWGDLKYFIKRRRFVE